MSQIKQSDLDILGYRPTINFVEPAVVSDVLIKVAGPTFEEKQQEWKDLERLSEAVRILAEAFQAKVDKKVAGFKVGLDPKADVHVMDSLRRRFPSANPGEITYEQYRECREAMRDHADQAGRGVAPDLSKIKDIRSGSDVGDLFDSNSPAALAGLANRPDLQDIGRIVEPIDTEEFQNKMLCMLMNMLWKKFIKGILDKTIPPPLNKLIPEELC
jgi:hypothetical protein